MMSSTNSQTIMTQQQEQLKSGSEFHHQQQLKPLDINHQQTTAELMSNAAPFSTGAVGRVSCSTTSIPASYSSQLHRASFVSQGKSISTMAPNVTRISTGNVSSQRKISQVGAATTTSRPMYYSDMSGAMLAQPCSTTHINGIAGGGFSTTASQLNAQNAAIRYGTVRQSSAAQQAMMMSGMNMSVNRITTGQQHTVGVNTYVDESRSHIVSERVTEREVRVPKRIVREDIVETVILVPERMMREEMTEEIYKVREKIIEVAKPVIRETFVEVPEIEYVEKIIEVPEIIVQEKIREIPRMEYQERIVEIPRYIQQEKIIEVPEIEYIEVPFEKIVEVPEVREQIVVKQIPVPRYVDKPYPEYKDVEVEVSVTRMIPVPVEAETTVRMVLPQLLPRYTRIAVPLYVPRFIEIAVPVEAMTEAATLNAEHYAEQVYLLASHRAASLCELEKLGGMLKNINDSNGAELSVSSEQDLAAMFESSWSAGRFEVTAINSMKLMSSATATMSTISHAASAIASTATSAIAAAATSAQVTVSETTSSRAVETFSVPSFSGSAEAVNTSITSTSEAITKKEPTSEVVANESNESSVTVETVSMVADATKPRQWSVISADVAGSKNGALEATEEVESFDENMKRHTLMARELSAKTTSEEKSIKAIDSKQKSMSRSEDEVGEKNPLDGASAKE